MPRNACVIQITPVRLTRTSANDASVVRKIYLSIDPIVPARSPPPRSGTTAGDQSRAQGSPLVIATVQPAYSLPSLCSVNKMAAPWHPRDIVNNSRYVASQPRPTLGSAAADRP